MYNILQSKEILQHFLNNFSNKLIIFNNCENRSDKVRAGQNYTNKCIFNTLNELYPNFFQSISELIFLSKLNNIDIIIKEKNCVCGNIKVYIGDKYKPYCSIKCGVINTKEKRNKTNLEKYGCINPFQSEQIKEKIKQTNLEKYGNEYPCQLEQFKEKTKETNLERYGSEYYTQTNEYKEKTKETNLERYGSEWFLSTDKFKEKSQKTLLENYGVDHNSKSNQTQLIRKQNSLEKHGVEYQISSKKTREKIQQTLMNKYNVENSSQIPLVREKIQQTLMDKYGVNHSSHIHLKNINDMNENFIYENFIKDGYFLLYEFMDYYNCSHNLTLTIREKFNIAEPVKINRQQTQHQIYEWFNFLKIRCLNNNKTIISPKELDIYLPDHKLAIEYDGLMFHSFGKNSWSVLDNHNKENENKYNHLNKTEECEKQGIQLLHIFENEWLEKEDLWKSVIMSKLGLNDKIYARKCQVKEVSNQDSNIFLIENHLQGECTSSIRLGLFYDEQLVSIMTFSKSRYNLSYEYELIRFCSLRGLTVVGGASKLFSYFVKNFKPKSVISYANRRWSNGNLYRQIGFVEVRKTTPNYFYFKQNEYALKSRMQFQKHKLKPLLDIYDDNLSETENMYNNDYRKIYDCGNLVFEWKSHKKHSE